MHKDANSKFDKNGFYIARGVFNKDESFILEKEFDKIIDQIKESGEDINAQWNSKLTSRTDPAGSSVLHTHNVQSYSNEMLKMVQDKRLLDITESLIGGNIILHHTKLFLKPPRRGSSFPLHQDWSYFPTKNNSMIAAVVHLSDSHRNMGRIRLVRGSHKMGRIPNSDGHSFSKTIHDTYKLEDSEAVDIQKGDVLFFHCCTLHGSNSNKSNKPRKTILIQLYSGNDQVEDSLHTDLKLTLRGWNYHATRKNVDGIKG